MTISPTPTKTEPSPVVTTVFVPGVGLWPRSLASVAAAVGEPTVLWGRSGYGLRPDVDGFADRVADVAAAVARHAPVRLVGVSGGATLALACALAAPDGLVAIVTHEPLVGPLEPTLHFRVALAGVKLQAEPGSAAAVEFLQTLYGSAGWERLGSAGRTWARHHHHIVCREVSQFAAFVPAAEQLEQISVDHLTTVGAASGPERHRVAELLARSGARVTTLAGVGHLAPVEDPVGFARALAGPGTADPASAQWGQTHDR